MKTPPLQRVCDCSRPQPKEQTDTVSTERAEWGSPVAIRMGTGGRSKRLPSTKLVTLLTTVFIICIGRAAGTILHLEALVTEENPLRSGGGLNRHPCCWTEACTGVRKIGASHVAVQRAPAWASGDLAVVQVTAN